MMKKTLSMAILISVYCHGFSQKDTVAVRFANSISSNDLKKHLDVLASDEYEGRETGQKGQKMAAQYIATHFSAIGIPPLAQLNNSYYQSFDLSKKELTSSSFSVFGNEQTLYEQYFTFQNGSDRINISSGKVHFLLADISGKKKLSYPSLNGQVVMCYKNQFEKVVGNILPADTILLYVVIDKEYSQTFNTYKHYLTKPVMQLSSEVKTKQGGMAKPLVIYIHPSVADKILQQTGEKERKKLQKNANKKGSAIKELAVPVELNIERKMMPYTAENVLGYIEGSDKKDELVVITAHYDHLGIENGEVFNGADDDGSGTVSIMEIAEAFVLAKKEGKGPRRSILIMPVAGEEKGLLGSKYYTDNPVFALKNTVVNLNIDMVGRIDSLHENKPGYIYLIGADMLSKELFEISEAANATYSGLLLDYKYADPKDENRFYYRSDHYNFAKNNIPVIFYFNGVHADYHKASDEVDKIDYSLMQKRAQLVFHTAWELANREERIKLNEPKK